MLNFIDNRRGLSRRCFLRVGSLGLGGLALPQFLAAKAAGAANAKVLRDKAVVFLFMHGGPSQIETFDPKMSAPAEIRSATGEVQTTIPGVTFGGTFPKLAERAKRLAIIRSFTWSRRGRWGGRQNCRRMADAITGTKAHRYCLPAAASEWAR